MMQPLILVMKQCYAKVDDMFLAESVADAEHKMLRGLEAS